MNSNQVYNKSLESNISSSDLMQAICNYFNIDVLEEFADYLQDEGLIE